MRRFEKALSWLLLLAMLVSLVPAGAVTAFAAPSGAVVFSWKGTQYSVNPGGSGSAEGASWSCDEDGKFSISYSESGTFILVSGALENTVATVIGGGAGGTSGWGSIRWGGNGGNGGGGGEKITSNVTVTTGTPYQVVVGNGGEGGMPVLVSGDGDLNGSLVNASNWTPLEMAFITSKGLGSAGEASSFGDVTAAGGQPDAGAAGHSRQGGGENATGNNGGGGGVVDEFYETGVGNNLGGWSCFICGHNDATDWSYGNPYPMPAEKSYEQKRALLGGAGGPDGGGYGGSPVGDHYRTKTGGHALCTPFRWNEGHYQESYYVTHDPMADNGFIPCIGWERTRGGAAGVDGTGGGGGGGGFAPRYYTVGGPGSLNYPYNGIPGGSTGSASAMHFVGTGGPGGKGAVSLVGEISATGKLKIMKSASNSDLTAGNSCYTLEGAEYSVYSSREAAENKENAVGMITVKADGSSDPIDIGAGDYFVRETKAPDGYALNSEIYTVTVEADKIATVNATDIPLADPVAIVLRKADADNQDEGVTSGNMSLAGAEYTLEFYGGQFATAAEAQASGDPLRHWVIKTNANGVADIRRPESFVSGDEFYRGDSGEISFPLGSVVIYESKAPTGYKLDNTKYIVNITEDRNSAMIRAYNAPILPEQPIRGGVKVTKVPSENLNGAMGGASLSGAEFSIYNNNGKDATVNGETYANGEVVLKITTNASGVATSANNVLPYGKYYIKETKAPAGFTVNNSWRFDFEIKNDRVIIDAGQCSDELIRGGILVQKLDKDTGTNHGIGNMELKGAEITIINRSAHAIIFDGREIAPYVGDFDRSNLNAEGIVTRISTDENGVASTAESVLPYGDYELFETKAPAGYDINTEWSKIAQIRSAGQMVRFEDGEALNDELARSDISLNKVVQSPNSTKPLGNIPFRLTNTTTGESHIIVTDANGSFNSANLVNSNHTNGNDSAYDGTTINDAMLNPSYGVWFGPAELVDSAPEGNHIGALSLGHYTLEELPCRANRRFTLSNVVEFDVTKRDNSSPLEIGTIINIAREGIETTLINSENNSHLANVGNVVLVDTVSYAGLVPGDEYEIRGVLMDKATGEALMIDGNKVEASKTFTPDEASGEVEIEFSFDASSLAGHSVVAFESLYIESELAAEHNDINDESQTVSFPAIATTAADAEGRKEMMAGENAKLVDTVRYENLDAGLTYVMKGSLMDPKTGNVLTDGEGNPMVAEKSFTPGERSGEVKVEFNFDASYLAGKTVVVFEELYLNDSMIASHKDRNDADQKVSFPKIGTTLVSTQGLHLVGADEYVMLKDTVKYENLIPDQEYVVEGELMDQADGSPAKDAQGAEITASATFTPTSANGTVVVEFVFDGSKLSGKSLVAFETLKANGVIMAKHEDLEDAAQTVEFSSLKTLAHDANGYHEVLVEDSISIIDDVSYLGLNPGKVYRVEGTLMDKATGEPALKADGSPITAFTEFTPDRPNGVISLTFVFDGASVEGKTLVAFETLYLDSNVVAEHKDINDADQTVNFPKIRTSAAVGGEREILAGETIQLVDTISYENLTVGTAYHVIGTLMDKASGEPIRKANGNMILAETDFTPQEANGTVEVMFEFDSSIMEGKTAVVFESISRKIDAHVIGEHKDLNDAEQTITFPQIRTHASSEDTGMSVAPAAEQTVILDEVEYRNLQIGKEYKVEGVLMDKETGSELLNASGAPYKASKTFTAQSENGSVTLEFIVDTSALAGKTMVAFEKVYDGERLIGVHADLSDEDQTIYIPTIRTTASDKQGEKDLFANGKIIVVDKVHYENLVPGVEYTMTGALADKESGEVLRDANGQKILSIKKFTPIHESGEIEITFEISADELEGKSLVAFELLSIGDVDLVKHADVEDADQTVYLPKIRTSAAVKGIHDAMAAESVTLVDTVNYWNLIPGETYRISGVLMFKENGTAAVSEVYKTFVPESANGSVDMTFIFDASNMAGKTLVAFETLDRNGKIVAEHKDLDDQEQTIRFPEIKTNAKDADTGSHAGVGIDGGAVTIIDTVTYKNLTPGKTYTIVGTVMDKATGEALLNQEGNPYTVSKEFIPEASNGSIDIEIEVSGKDLKGMTLVMFETLKYGVIDVAIHADINDADQTIWYPAIGTTAADANGSKVIEAKGNVEIIDVVAYKNLIPGTEYRLDGALMADASTKIAEASVTFTPESANGSVEVKFSIDAASLAGKKLVAFESLFINSSNKLVANHNDLDDEAQTVYIPKIGTEALINGRHEAEALSDVRLVDTITFENLMPGETYKASGVLMNKATGEVIRNADGNEIVSESEFVAPTGTPNGAVDVIFRFDASLFAGKDIVVFETVTLNGKIVAQHKDLNDEAQTISFPSVGTTALSKDTDKHIAPAQDGIIIIDKVDYKNLEIGGKYVLVGTLMDLATGEAIMSADGRPFIGQVEFTAESRNGSIDVELPVDAVALAGKTAVVFETLSRDGERVAQHNDLNDQAQTIRFPKIGTSAADKDGYKEFEANGKLTIIDTVSYENLIPNMKYTLSGKLMDKDSGEELGVTASVDFIPKTADGSYDVKFTMNAGDLEGKTIVAFEELLLGDVKIAEHEDIEDQDQTVTFPKIRTVATVNGVHEVKAEGEITLIDEVKYENLKIGETYKISGILMNKSSGQPVRDADGNEITAEVEFIADKRIGSAYVEFKFDASRLEGISVVAFETMTVEKRVVASHAKIDDADQTVTFPKIRTNAVNDLTRDHIAPAEEQVTIIDTVTYSNLQVGKEYTINGKLMDKESGEPVLNAASEPYTATVTFTAENANGSIDLTFVVDASALAGKSVVAFESLVSEGREVAAHADIEDADQTVVIPFIATEASDTASKFDGNADKAKRDLAKEILADGSVTIKDVVSYNNLIPGKTYTISGVLMDKESNEALLDESGAKIVGSKTFKAPAADGEIEILFTVDANVLAGKTLVAFETLSINGVDIYVHADIEDADQTVTFPEISTNLTDKEYGEHVAQPGKVVTLVDRVEYKNLVPGRDYKVSGKLMIKEDGKELKGDDGEIIAAEQSFKADESGSGYVDLVFTFDASLLEGKTVVAFERVENSERVVAVHEDIEDEDQSVHFPEIHTEALSEDGKHTVWFDKDAETIKIIDTVSYKNLIPGLEYKVSGTLMDRESLAPIKPEGSEEPYMSEATFVPTEAGGEVKVEFEIPVDLVFGKYLVAYESLTLNSATVAVHADPKDEAQTVFVPYLNKVLKYDASNHAPLAGAKFEIRDTLNKPDDAPIIATSDDTGYFFFNGIPGHDYTIREIKAPDDYILNRNALYLVHVEDDGTLTGDIEIANIHGGTIIITKTDVVTGQPVANCEISVYKLVHPVDEEATKKAIEEAAKKAGVSVEDFDGEVEPVLKKETERQLVFSQKTNEAGHIYFYTSQPGTYIYKETVTCYGYYLNEDEYTITVDEDMTVHGNTHITNVPFGTAVLHKVDSDGKPLAGAEFAVYSEDGKFLGKGVSNEQGRVYFVSPGPGKYYFVETKAPQGYNRVDTRYHFEIASDYTIMGNLKIVNSRGNTPSTSTGDSTNIALWLGAAACCFLGGSVALFFLLRKKKEDKAEDNAK